MKLREDGDEGLDGRAPMLHVSPMPNLKSPVYTHISLIRAVFLGSVR